MFPCPKDSLVKIREFANDPKLSICGTFTQEIDSLSNKGSIRKVPTQHEEIVNALYLCPLNHPSVMFRKSHILSIGGYDSKLRRRQDYELWFRSAHEGLKFRNLPVVLLLYRFNSNTHRKQPTKLALQQSLIGFRGSRMLKYPLWKQTVCFVPLIRSLLPVSIQHHFYRLLKPFDPRAHTHKSETNIND